MNAFLRFRNWLATASLKKLYAVIFILVILATLAMLLAESMPYLVYVVIGLLFIISCLPILWGILFLFDPSRQNALEVWIAAKESDYRVWRHKHDGVAPAAEIAIAKGIFCLVLSTLWLIYTFYRMPLLIAVVSSVIFLLIVLVAIPMIALGIITKIAALRRKRRK